MKVEFSKKSLEHIEHIYNYLIEMNTPSSTRKILREIYNTTQQLKKYASLGRLWQPPNTRKIVVPRQSYVILYEIKKDKIAILSITHTSRRIW